MSTNATLGLTIATPTPNASTLMDRTPAPVSRGMKTQMELPEEKIVPKSMSVLPIPAQMARLVPISSMITSAPVSMATKATTVRPTSTIALPIHA